MTLLARDEADVVDAQLTFHFAVGVDFVVATDHRSTDGTREILERYEREGRLQLLREDGETVLQGPWVTRMARIAALEHGADWIVNADADEFWWPRIGALPDLFAAVPSRYAGAKVLIRSFVPRPDDGRPFAERLTVRLAAPAAINAPTTPFRAVSKVAHRAAPDVRVGQGSHAVHGLAGDTLPGPFPVDVLHFPFRSADQVTAKHVKTLESWPGNLRGDLARARRLIEAGRLAAFNEELVVDDETLRRGLADGSLQEDTRLRDALRELARGGAPRLDGASTSDGAAFGVEASCVAEAEVVRLQRHIDVLAARLAGVERS